MNTAHLKKVFDAARKIQGHNIEEACDAAGYHATTIRRLFDGSLEYPAKPRQAVLNYIYESGLQKSLDELKQRNNKVATN